MTRVALVKHSAVGRHGGTRLFFRLARELRDMGVEVEVIVHDHDPDAAFPGWADDLPIRVRRMVRYEGPVPFPVMLAQQEAHSRALAAMIPPEADVINVHEWRGLRAGALARRGRPLVWSCNDPSPWDLAAARGSLPQRALGKALGWADRLYAVSRVDRTVVLSEQAREVMRRSAAIDAAVVRCGVDVDDARRMPPREVARSELGLGDRVVALGVGILVPRRRFEDLIEAVSRVDGVHALIVGTDQLDRRYAERLRTLARDLDVEGRVTFVMRAVTEEELWRYYAAADLFVFPNEEQTWGLAVTEAMAAGLPCVVSTGAGVHEVLTDGATALLVPPRSPDALAGAIGRLAGDPALRERIGREAARWVASELTWRRFARGMLRSYAEAGSNTPMSSGSVTAP